MLRKVLPILLLLLTGCIDPLEFNQKEQKEHLVVEGSFTNRGEFNYVRLSYSQPYAYPYNKFEENADVFVTSDEGEWFRFVKDAAGYYYPESATDSYGIIGHTYTLNVIANGKTYKSRPATLKEPVPIDSVHFELDEQVFSFEGYLERKLHMGYRVLVDYQDPGGEKNFYRWSFASEYQVQTQPEDYIDFSGNPAPKSCCARCFLKEKLDRFKVANDRLNNGRKVINQEVLFIPFERYLGVKHVLKVYQHALTEDAYSFFRVMEQQKEATGTVFDPPPAEVKGNMYCVEDEEEQVIGLFEASAVSMKEVTILREDIDYPVVPFRFPDDCRVLPSATTEVPEGW